MHEASGREYYQKMGMPRDEVERIQFLDNNRVTTHLIIYKSISSF